MERTFTLAQVLNLLVAMDQGINPETYPSSRNLGPEDFMDLATCKAQELNITDEFNKAREDYGNHSQTVLDSQDKS